MPVLMLYPKHCVYACFVTFDVDRKIKFRHNKYTAPLVPRVSQISVARIVTSEDYTMMQITIQISEIWISKKALLALETS